jgi:hypothetical protein
LLEWYWPLTDARGRGGEVRWAVHSFELGRNIAIAVADAALQPGETVQICHQAGSSRGTVSTLPFV